MTTPTCASTLTRLLGTRWTVEAVGDGAAALAAIRQRRPTLVITDVMMPGLDGFGFLRALRQDPETRTIPVIMLSARAGEDSRIDGLEAGADDYLVKPFSARELMARVATHLNLQRLEQRLDQQRAALTELFRQSPLPVAVVRGPDLVFEIANAAYWTSSETGRSSASRCSTRFRSCEGRGSRSCCSKSCEPVSPPWAVKPS